MSAASHQPAPPPPARTQRLRARAVRSANNAPRRRRAIGWAKRLLPVGALMLLGAVALWPQLDRDTDQERVTLRKLSAPVAGGARMSNPRYRSVDDRQRPFTVTAESGVQIGPDQVKLAEPKGDIALENGSWIEVEARHGVFAQHENQLDLSDDAQLYRSDGTTMTSDSAVIDTKAGSVASPDRTHAEGPFGTLDAQGFTLLDRGETIQFAGPARLRLRGADSTSAQNNVPQNNAPLAETNQPPPRPHLTGMKPGQR